MLLLQLESPLEVVQRAAEAARAHNVQVVLNPAPARPLPTGLLHLVDFLIPNESETKLLTGMSITSLGEAQSAAAKLQQMGVRTIVLTLGERGAMLVTGQISRLFPAFSVDPMDTTAAGDAFVGGFATALSEGKTLEDAVLWGNAAGALATTRLGAQPSLPMRAALEHLITEGRIS